MRKELIVFVITLSLLTFLASGTNGAASVSWGVEETEVITYWIDEILFSELGPSNVAGFLLGGDANRTNIVVITDTEATSLNYTLALMNGSDILEDQQISVEELQIEGQAQTLLLPNGDLPLILPLSAGNQGNYLEYLASTAGLANFVIEGLLSQENITNIVEPEIAGYYTGGWLNLTASVGVDDISSLTGELMPELNVTDTLFLGLNQSINDVSVDLLVGYNATDGTLMEVTIDAEIDTTQLVENQMVNRTMTFNASIIRQSYLTLSEILSQNSSLISQAADSNFLFLATIPAFFLLTKRKS